MNLLLLRAGELAADGTVRLTGRRQQHAREVLHANVGESLRVGVRGGLTGTGVVRAQSDAELVLEVSLTEPPPPRPGVDVVLAMPRPKALKRVIPALASLGVDRVMVVNAAKVEKSYFDSKVLAPELLDELIDLGLEQARDTVPPSIEVRTRFKPFVEDELPGWARTDARYVPHPLAATPLRAAAPGTPLLIAIGPDGGWVDFEVQLLAAHGFTPVSLGPRPLRVEVAVPAVIAALRPALAP